MADELISAWVCQKDNTLIPGDQTEAGKPRQRRAGGGTKGKLQLDEDKLLLILVYQKTYPLHTMQGLQFELSQPQANYWVHRLMAVLQEYWPDLAKIIMTCKRPVCIA